MAPPAALANAVGVTEGDLDPDQYLGRLATFTHPDAERKLNAFIRSWGTNGLDVDDLPEARQRVDVARTAMASVRKRRHVDEDGVQREIRSDEVAHTRLVCTYQVTLVEWDEAARVIEHQKGMRVEFDKQLGDFTVEQLDGYTPALGQLEQAIRAHYDANGDTIPGPKIRNAIRGQIERAGGQNLRRKAGGLYFVPATCAGPNGTREDTRPILDGLRGVLADMYAEDGDFYTVPLVNNDGAQAMVRKHFVINSRDELEKLTIKAIQRVRAGKGRGVRDELLTNLYRERRRVLQAVSDFEQLVDLERADVGANLKDLDAALEQLEELRNS